MRCTRILCTVVLFSSIRVKNKEREEEKEGKGLSATHCLGLNSLSYNFRVLSMRIMKSKK